MSWVAVAVGVGTAALGAGVGAYEQNKTLKAQDQAAAAGIARQNLLRSQAQGDVSNVIQKRATENQANVQANQNAEQQAYAAALQRAAPVQNGAIVSQPGASKRYAADVTASRANVGQFGQDLAARTAAIDAPTLTNNQTALALGDTATKLGQLSDTSGNLNSLTQMQVNGIRANPWVLAAGQAAQGAGTAYAGNALGGYFAKPKFSPNAAGIGPAGSPSQG